MTALAWGIVAAVAAAALAWGLWRAGRERRRMRRLSAMLEAAIAGRDLGTQYDESVCSALEQQMERFLSAHQLAERRLETEQAQIRTLIADISHQTKTPIANLLLYTQLLQEQPLEPEGRASLEQIEAQVKKLQFLIDALVKMSRLESGILSLHPQAAPVQPLLEKVAQQFESLAEQKQISLRWEPTVLVAQFDSKWTLEALGNLVDNAIKYTPAGGTVHLRAEPLELFCRLDVTDTGIGIAEAEYSKIFSRFYRAQQVANEPGVGIGLYLAREILTAEGGYLRVRSKPGAGSCFSLFLPRAQCAEHP
ncbi:MAG: HAMP domain-containing histidine kinase [Clostridiales bacterium]|nr:HAMP domain-containing histidine kinase [Clostridiales bacterium]